MHSVGRSVRMRQTADFALPFISNSDTMATTLHTALLLLGSKALSANHGPATGRHRHTHLGHNHSSTSRQVSNLEVIAADAVKTCVNFGCSRKANVRALPVISISYPNVFKDQ